MERLAQDCFNHKFLPDRGTPTKNMPPIDEFDDGDTVSTCHELQISSCIYPSAAVRNISDMTLNSDSTISIGYDHIVKKEEAKK